MAMDYARYMVENKDVYDEFRKPGSGRPNWTWDNGRKAGTYLRNDGTYTPEETAAQYAEAHYRNFGKAKGRKMYERKDDTYEKQIRAIDAGGSGSDSELNAELTAMVKSLPEIANDPNATKEQKAATAGQSKSILTNFEIDDPKKKKSFLSPMGG